MSGSSFDQVCYQQRDLLSGRYWISFFPGIALLITIASINLVGDQLRDVLNPRRQG